MRIFVLLSRVPYPLEKGDKLRAFHQIKQLAANNEIILCALNPVAKLDKQKAFRELQPYCRSINFLDIPCITRYWNMVKALFTGMPIQTGYFYSRKAAKEIDRLIKTYNPDHLYCQFIRTTEYLKKHHIPKTVDYQDVLSFGMKRRMEKASLIKRPLFSMEYQRLLKYERRVFDMFDNKTIISYPDQRLIDHPEKEKIHVIPNGVDHDFFKPQKKDKKYDIVFTGNMAYPPNVDASEFLVNEIMPHVWKKYPGAKLLLAGASPTKRVLNLGRKNVTVSGWMDDIRDSYAESKIFIAPMRIGTGLQNKLLEAMSMQIPTITTPLANDALCAKDGEEILIGENSESLGNQIISLLEDKEKREKLAIAGYDFVHQNHSWKMATEKLDELINNS